MVICLPVEIVDDQEAEPPGTCTVPPLVAALIAFCTSFSEQEAAVMVPPVGVGVGLGLSVGLGVGVGVGDGVGLGVGVGEGVAVTVKTCTLHVPELH